MCMQFAWSKSCSTYAEQACEQHTRFWWGAEHDISFPVLELWVQDGSMAK